jgi:hypothetical protein
MGIADEGIPSSESFELTPANFVASCLRQLKRLKLFCNNGLQNIAKVAELADAPDLGTDFRGFCIVLHLVTEQNTM